MCFIFVFAWTSCLDFFMILGSVWCLIIFGKFLCVIPSNIYSSCYFFSSSRIQTTKMLNHLILSRSSLILYSIFFQFYWEIIDAHYRIRYTAWWFDLHVLWNNYNRFSYHPSSHMNTIKIKEKNIPLMMKTLSICSLVSYSTLTYSQHAVCYIPCTYLSPNRKFKTTFLHSPPPTCCLWWFLLWGCVIWASTQCLFLFNWLI